MLEALFDSFAVGGRLPERIAAAFHRPDPDDTLAGVVAAFAHFWGAGRAGMRRVRVLGVLDRELGEAIDARNERRRAVVRAVVQRFVERYGRPAAASDRGSRSYSSRSRASKDVRHPGGTEAQPGGRRRGDRGGRARRDRVAAGKMSTTDGPFAETKEQLGGFYVINARA